MLKAICLFRNSEYFSIEHVFEILKPFLNNKCRCEYLKVPYTGATFFSLVNNLLFAYKLNKNVPIHITGDINYVALALKGTNTILTIHDLIYLEDNKSSIIKQILTWLWYKFPIYKVRFITCVSNETRSQLLKYFPKSPKEKIFVIPDPLDINFYPHPKIFNDNNPRLLFIGTKKNKNLFRTIQALKGIKCHLRIIGKIPEDQIRILQENNINWSNVQGVSNEEMMQEYIDCDLLCFPSLAEGFGMPIIEAQAIGRPVLTSNCSSMPEVAGEKGAVMVDPQDIHSIHEGIKKIINDSELRIQLINQGYKNIERFFPERIADMYIELYNRIVDNK